MGGPTSFVLLPEPLSSEQHKELLDLMAQLGEIEENFKSRSGTKTEHEADTYYLQIINSSAFGLNLPDIGGWPFIVSYERLPSWELKALKVVEQKIGFKANYMIQLDACCSDTHSHRLLGLLTLECCERFQGLIHMGGALFPPSTPDSPDVWDLDWREAERYSREYFDRLPGTLITVPYVVSEERDWFYYVVDSTFMRAWLADPNFYMVK